VIAVPAWVWRGGPIYRAGGVGLPAGAFFGGLALADSGLVPGAVVFVVVGTMNGILTARRMAKYWPGARELSGSDRVAVVRASRRGEPITDARLAPAVIGYSAGLRAAHEKALPYRWLVWLLIAGSLVIAVIDSVTGPVNSAVVSWLFVGFFAIELFWWPRRQNELLTNAQRAEAIAHQLTPVEDR